MTSDIPQSVLEFALDCDSYRENAPTMPEENRLLMRLDIEFTVKADPPPIRGLPD